jgi:hypothetical protein
MEARIKLEFYGTDKSKTNEHSLVAYSNFANEIYLAIDMGDVVPSFICLDKPTAVRLVRELKKQIGNLESEVTNE